MRLIDADVLKYALGCSDEAMRFDAMIDEMPTINLSPVWTPCDKGLPDYGVKCNVTVSVDMGDGASDVFVPTFAMHHNGVDWYDEDGYDYSHFKVLAWQPLSKPYNPNKAREA